MAKISKRDMVALLLEDLTLDREIFEEVATGGEICTTTISVDAHTEARWGAFGVDEGPELYRSNFVFKDAQTAFDVMHAVKEAASHRYFARLSVPEAVGVLYEHMRWPVYRRLLKGKDLIVGAEKKSDYYIGRLRTSSEPNAYRSWIRFETCDKAVRTMRNLARRIEKDREQEVGRK